MAATEIHYKVPWRTRGSYPGHHLSQQKGGGLEFRNHVPLIDAPDPRRFDVRASLRDPFGQIQVRIYQQSSSIPVYVVADLSASMSYRGARDKLAVLGEFIECLGYSAYRTGDAFGFIGCASGAVQPMFVPASLRRSVGAEIVDLMAGARLPARDAEGLLHAADLVGARRALVFLVSDFHLPEALIEQVLATLAYHDVVPVVMWDEQEYAALPTFGLARVHDRETGRERLLFMRPRLRARIAAGFARRRAALERLCARVGRAPLVLTNGFVADEVTNYFYV